MTWAVCLQRTDPGLTALMDALRGGAACVMLTGLSDPSGNAGAVELAGYIRHALGVGIPAVLELPVCRKEDTSAARALLMSGQLNPLLTDICLVGMPEDCRSNTDGPNLADWMAAIAAVRLLEGMHGTVTWRVPAENLGWDAFGLAADSL